jgi:catechol 2,3-dioxygenase-like lactoylglutathione lyase family enzyme
MKIRLESVFISDIEKALAFYTDVLGFIKKQDIPMGDTRFVTVVSPDEPDAAELMLEPNGEHPPTKAFKTRSSMSRRHFLETAALAGSATAIAGSPLNAAPVPKSPVEGETEHFWYRLAPTDPYNDSQRDNKAFGFRDETILLSEDNGKTWPHAAEFPYAKNITFSCILKTGNIVFATRTKLYLSTDNLKTFKQITVKDRDGSDYLPHTPHNPDQPGWYFHPLDGVHTWDVDGREMLVWGNYCNVIGGSVPVNIYYSTDQGRTVKIAYSFGRNPRYTDGGTPLGDPDNPVICRHIHSVAYNSKENAFYACTGDHDLETKHECHWLRGLYDQDKDTWTWKVLESTDSNTRYKSGGINFVDGNVYWAADANGRKPHDRGIFRCDPADIATPSKHTMLFNPEYESANMIIEDGVMLSAHYAPASPYHTGFIISPDMGKTWAQYDLKQFGKRSPVRFQRKNSDGWFRVDLRKGWIERGEVLFIKPK